MKRLSSIWYTILLISILMTACGGGSPADGIPTEETSAPDTVLTPLGKIQFGVDASLPPFELLDANTNQLSGFDIELMQAIAAKAGYEVEFIRIEYGQLISRISQCQLDGGISAIPITDALKQQMAFSDPYYRTSQVLVIKKGNILITDLNTLSGMTVGAQAGTPSEMEIGKIGNIKTEINYTINEVFQKLMAGYTDAVVADKPRALSFVEIKPNNLQIIGEEFGSIDYGIAVCKNQTDLLMNINKGLADIKTDGTMDKLLEKWILKAAQ